MHGDFFHLIFPDNNYPFGTTSKDLLDFLSRSHEFLTSITTNHCKKLSIGQRPISIPVHFEHTKKLCGISDTLFAMLSIFLVLNNVIDRLVKRHSTIFFCNERQYLREELIVQVNDSRDDAHRRGFPVDFGRLLQVLAYHILSTIGMV